MKIDQDIIQRIKVTGIFCLQFYKVLTGTMLSLFIPQACYESISDGSEIIYTEEVRICTLSQNFENNEIYHRLTLYWNSISFLCFIYCYLLELKRESWAIKFLDVDKDKSDNALKEIIVNEPKLDKRMDKLNRLYFYGLSVTSVVYAINVLMMINVLYQDYHSMSTISCFISFTLLVQMKLYNSLSIAYKSVKNDTMLSAFLTEFVSFNVLDKDYISDKNNP
tara:strand:+ start:3960 stop:4625 length:666 start_codon:yes stop_codon:yes gene_type:complete